MNNFFLVLLLAHFLFLGLHDWVPLGRWTDLPALRSQRSLKARILASVIMAAIQGIALYLNWSQSPHPSYGTRLFTLILYAAYIPGMLRAWWLPYLFGVGLSEKFIADYKIMFGNTITWFPERNGITVNALHTVFHISVVVELILAAIRFWNHAPRSMPM
jgi:hypothetical protein